MFHLMRHRHRWRSRILSELLLVWLLWKLITLPFKIVWWCLKYTIGLPFIILSRMYGRKRDYY